MLSGRRFKQPSARCGLRPSASAAPLKARAVQQARRMSSEGTQAPPTPRYYSQEYWDSHYASKATKGGIKEWHCSYEDISNSLSKYISKSQTILNVGCGDSDFAISLAKDGFSSVNIDFSATVIQQAQESVAKSGLANNPIAPAFLHVDATKMTFNSASIDTIIDKGCLDAMLTADDPQALARQAVSEYHRVLRPAGIVFLMSYLDKTTLVRDLFVPSTWTLRESSLEGGFYLHVLTPTPLSANASPPPPRAATPTKKRASKQR